MNAYNGTIQMISMFVKHNHSTLNPERGVLV